MAGGLGRGGEGIFEANNTIGTGRKPGKVITIPSQMRLPDAPREGVIVNLAELRLDYYPPGENRVRAVSST